MRTDLARRALFDHRRSLLVWALGVSVYVAMIVLVWPSLRDSDQLSSAVAEYPETLQKLFGGDAGFDFATAAGYLHAELFSLMFPLFLAVFAITFAATVLPGEEERGQLALVLAGPVRRRRIVGEKAGALAAALVAVAAVSGVVAWGVGRAVDLGVPVGNLAAAVVGSALAAAVIGAVTLCAGAATGSRAAAIGVGALVFGGGYLLQVVGAFVDALAPLRWVSPLHIANGDAPVRTGWPWPAYGGLLALTIGFVAVAAVAFERRDLRV